MIVFLYSIFAILCGVIEAVLYSRRGAESFTRNEHIDMTLQRIAAALLAPAGALLYAWQGSAWLVVAELVPAALLFPLFHDEAYNFTRLWISESEKAGTTAGAIIGRYPFWLAHILPTNSADGRALTRALDLYRYGYQSPTTTARNDFNGTQRSWLAVAGLAILTGLYFFL